ncbi:MAG TPA: nitroreductase family protein [Ignavibacteria bacterium]|nr:nitroreductase family protein [Ignavibacteria bacterium]
MSDFIKLDFIKKSEKEILKNSEEFYNLMNSRRTVREFSPEKIDIKIIENAVKTAGTAPSGAHKQPWRYVIVESPEIKHEIRIAAEKEEKENYESRFPESWKKDLESFGTDWHKEFLDTAPYLIVVFKVNYEKTESELRKHYYVNESIGISVGMLLTALHFSGLVTLTHTPNPMKFLQKILNRPDNETPYLLIPVGFPAENVSVPVLKRKELDEYCIKL